MELYSPQLIIYKYMFEEYSYVVFIYATVALALLWAIYNAWVVLSISLKPKNSSEESLISNEKLEEV